MLESVPFEIDPECTRYNVLLALQEMVTNVLRHAYDGDDSQPVEVQFTVTEEAFELELRDRGPAFDPLAHDVSMLLMDTSMPTAAGGFGIHITRLVMDRLEYANIDGWNTLRMAKLVRTPQQTH
jgi:serine/threonine-protein kinase RsbW